MVCRSQPATAKKRQGIWRARSKERSVISDTYGYDARCEPSQTSFSRSILRALPGPVPQTRTIVRPWLVVRLMQRESVAGYQARQTMTQKKSDIHLPEGVAQLGLTEAEVAKMWGVSPNQFARLPAHLKPVARRLGQRKLFSRIESEQMFHQQPEWVEDEQWDVQ